MFVTTVVIIPLIRKIFEKLYQDFNEKEYYVTLTLGVLVKFLVK